jgi:hypothetical protein
MASTTETGHAKNVINFESLITNVISFGTMYNPSKTNLKIPALNTLLTNAKVELKNVSLKSIAYNNATNARQLLYEPLKPLGTRLINALKATDASELLIKDAKTINAKLQGKRIKAIAVPTDPNAPIPITISVSQQSYDLQSDNLSKFIDLLKSEPSFIPNENDLKLVTLNNTLNNMKTANVQVIETFTDISNSRNSRNKMFYKEKTGLCDVAQDVKNYVKSIYGATSSEYKQISKIKFTIPRM